MKFPTLSLLAPPLLASIVDAKATCTPSAKVSPKPQYDFSINLVLGPSLDLGIDIYAAHQTYLAVTGGTFCAKWHGGITGTVVPGGSVSYRQVSNGTGPYKLSLTYLLKTDDAKPAYIFVTQTGWEVDFVGRTNYVFETGDERYSAVNTGVYIGVETGYVNNATGTFSSADGYELV